MTSSESNQQKTPLSRRERERLQRRNDIINTAEKRFFGSGFDGVSMDDIAKDLELSKPALYRYFRNKESLYLAVVLRGMLVLRETFKAAVAKEQTGIGKVSAFLNALCFDYVHKHGDYYLLITVAREQRFMELFKRGEVDGASEFGNMALESLTLLVDAIQLGSEDETIRADLPPLQTAIFLVVAAEAAVNIGPYNQNLLKQIGLSKEEYLQHSIDLMLRGITAKL
ncbi:MAG: TetR/AcrR family transcriptional regulator [Candidatus Bathyarchaeia archaeon]|jgi:AcrR family transcriptional regulator